ncbi:MAG: hypothetical protein QF371_00200, partial [Flavobacteriales bacterium]|nr:hypothetical protein [Flavobacteriales bacterium]
MPYLFPMRPTAIIFLLFLASTVLAQEIALKSEVNTQKKQSTVKKETLGDSTASVLIKGKLYDAIIVDGDTIAVISLPPARATARRVFKSKRAEKKYRRLVFHIKKVLPYAK